MIPLTAFIIGAGWGMIIHDLMTLNDRIHKGDELDNTKNDYFKERF